MGLPIVMKSFRAFHWLGELEWWFHLALSLPFIPSLLTTHPTPKFTLVRPPNSPPSFCWPTCSSAPAPATALPLTFCHPIHSCIRSPHEPPFAPPFPPLSSCIDPPPLQGCGAGIIKGRDRNVDRTGGGGMGRARGGREGVSVSMW